MPNIDVDIGIDTDTDQTVFTHAEVAATLGAAASSMLSWLFMERLGRSSIALAAELFDLCWHSRQYPFLGQGSQQVES